MKKYTTILGIMASGWLLTVAALADENGNPKVTPPAKCPASPSFALDFICSALGQFGGSCKTTADACNDAEQELFTGLDIEGATPKNIKPWTGFGAGGTQYTAAAACLAKDLETTPMSSHSQASVGLGTFSVDQTVSFTGWDKSKAAVSGVQSARVCGPVIGCLDAYQQPFTLTPVKSTINGQTVGGYKVFAANALNLSTKGMAQGLAVALPAFQVDTPYGSIKATPTFAVTRGVGWVLAPYSGGNAKSQVPMKSPAGNFTLKGDDLYGRLPGLKASQADPFYGSGGGWYPANHAWISQAGLGARSGLISADVWKAAAGETYPVRPDFGNAPGLTPRVDGEKTPNAGLMAAVKIAYSPVDLIPDWIRNSAFIDIGFEIYVMPNVEVGAASQLNFWNAEGSHWKGQINNPALANPPPTVTPLDLTSQHHFQMYAASSAAARFALDAGVDFKLVLNIPLLFKTIHKTIIDIHPKTTVAETTDEGRKTAAAAAGYLADSAAFVATGKPFAKYRTLSGAEPDPVSHVKMCLAQPSVSKPPATPSYTPGNPKDLVNNLQLPCNICLGMESQDFESQVVGKPPKKEHIEGFLTTIKPVSQANMPAASRWSCNSLAKVGCYDMCLVSKDGKSMSVAETAKDMLASGKLKSTNQRLMCQ